MSPDVKGPANKDEDATKLGDEEEEDDDDEETTGFGGPNEKGCSNLSIF